MSKLNLLVIEIPTDGPPNIVDKGGLDDWIVYAALDRILALMDLEDEAGDVEVTKTEEE